jgi:hypothetical protein
MKKCNHLTTEYELKVRAWIKYELKDELKVRTRTSLKTSLKKLNQPSRRLFESPHY